MKSVLVCLGAAVGLWLLAVANAQAGSCYSVRVQGCGKKARVCVNTGSSSDAEARAVKAFKDTNKCGVATVSSYSSSCSEAANDRCDIKL